MSKLKFFVCTILSLVISMSVTACGGETPDKPDPTTVQSIEIAEAETQYLVGESFKGGKIKVFYSDGTSKTEQMTETMLTGFDTASAGNKTVTVTYEKQKIQFNITVTEKFDIPLEKNFDVKANLADKEGWLGGDSKTIVLDDNGFMIFREKSNNVVTYKNKGMSDGVLEFLMKVEINSDTTATVMFSNRSNNVADYYYKSGSEVYTLEFSNTQKVFIKKWIDGHGANLTGPKASAPVPLALATKFTEVKIEVTEQDKTVGIKVYIASKLVLDVHDKTEPILGGGAIGFAYTGTGGMAVCGKGTDLSKYKKPEALGINVYSSPNVPVADTTVDLLADFANKWTGRERIFNTKVEENGSVLFSTKDNPEEPMGGVGEYQGVYQDKIFGTCQLEYKFNVLSQGEWVMFWFRCVPEKTSNISIWGNKKTRENTNGYSMLIDPTGKVQIHKWSDFAQIWLNGEGTQLPGNVVKALKDSKSEITLKMSIEEITVSGRPAIEFRISVNDSDLIVVQDTEKTVFTNAGYVGVQGFSMNNGECAVRINSAVVKTEIDL